MHHVFWALLALLAYSFLPPLVKVGVEEMPADAALFVVNGTLMVLLPAIMLVRREPIVPYLTHPTVPYLIAAGVALTIALTSFYRGLAAGPVSTVVPIFGMFLVLSSAIGFVFFEEPASARKLVAIAMGVGSIYLVSTG